MKIFKDLFDGEPLSTLEVILLCAVVAIVVHVATIVFYPI